MENNQANTCTFTRKLSSTFKIRAYGAAINCSCTMICYCQVATFQTDFHVEREREIHTQVRVKTIVKKYICNSRLYIRIIIVSPFFLLPSQNLARWSLHGRVIGSYTCTTTSNTDGASRPMMDGAMPR